MSHTDASEAAGPRAALERADEAAERADLDGVIAHLSAALRGFTAADEPCRAAMVCVRLGDVYTNAMGNQTAGRAWFARAARLVDGRPPCLEQGWVAVAAMGCDVDDPAVLLERAELALDRARRFGDLNLETKALADAGLAHVQAGRIPMGMALLDEAMALACGPADDRDTAAKSVCSFFTACYYAADFERAGAWADLLRRQGLVGPEPGGPVFLSSHCDSVEATLLIELGRWSEAEALLTKAKVDFETAMAAPSWHPDIALADLRTRQGRLCDAEALLVGKDQSMEALLPAARLHLARDDQGLARDLTSRGLRAVGQDRLRAIDLLTTLVDVELAAGDLDAAVDACAALRERLGEVDVPPLRLRATAVCARLMAASGDLHQAIESLEASVDGAEAEQLPSLRIALLVDLARFRSDAGDSAGAARTVETIDALLAPLDISLSPDDVAMLSRLRGARSVDAGTRWATMRRDGSWWEVCCAGTTVRLRDTKGLRYLAELMGSPGNERHVLDLVDRIEGPGSDGSPDRRTLGDAGPLLDTRARATYRRRIEELRVDVDDAMAGAQLETAEALQAELDLLVEQLAQAFGLGGRSRVAASAAERARLNVTRALRAALARLSEALPEPGTSLGCQIRTGMYCAYEPTSDGVHWVVQS